MLLLQALDHSLSRFLSQIIPHTLFFDRLFSFLSLQYTWIFFWIVVFIVYTIWEERKHKAFIFYFILALTIAFFLTNILIKNIVRRERPWVANMTSNAVCPVDYSFPSAHAATAFAAAAICAYFDRKRRHVHYAIATSIAYSRIYLHCHYFSDVVFGALIGYIIARSLVSTMSHSETRRIH